VLPGKREKPNLHAVRVAMAIESKNAMDIELSAAVRQ